VIEVREGTPVQVRGVLPRFLGRFFQIMLAVRSSDGCSAKNSLRQELSVAEVNVLLDKMFEYLQFYRLELALETVRRKADVKAVPATWKTIFTDRDL
jgi:hypothetical protein